MNENNFIMSYSVDTTFESDKFLKIRCRVCHDGESPNKTYFTKETMEKANKESLEYIPILAHVYVDNNGKPVIGAHDIHIEEDKLNDGETRLIYDESPIGMVPSIADNNWSIEEYNGLNYTFVDAYIWRDYSNYAEQLVEDAEHTKMSMEIDFPTEALSYDIANDRYNISSYRYRGITLLNENCGTGMKDALVTTTNFSINDDIKTKVIVLMEELQRCLREYDIDNSKKGGISMNHFEELLAKYGKTVEDITFEYEGMTDEELDNKFAEVFGEDEVEDNEINNDNPVTKDPEDDNSEGSEGTPEEPKIAATEEPVESETEVFMRAYTLSHDDIRCALYAMLMPYEETDNTTYYICDVFDDYFVYESWCGKTAYGQAYVKDEETVSFNGERYELFREWLTASQKAELEAMRSNYSEISDKLKTYEDAEVEAKKLELLNADDYASVRDTESFAELVKDHANISFEDLQSKCDKLLLDAVKSGKYSAVNSTEDTTKTSKKQFTNPTVQKSKPSRYGKLFAKEND